jgi:hypothetical protein
VTGSDILRAAPGAGERASADVGWMRLDTAGTLVRFYFLERAVTIAAAGWIPGVHRIEAKAALARLSWQSAMTAEALRQRVLELRFPNRKLSEGAGEPFIRLFDAANNAPSQHALLRALGEVLLPALGEGYTRYLDASDELADGPSLRFIGLALREKDEQIRALAAAAAAEPSTPRVRADADRWVGELERVLGALGGICRERPMAGVHVAPVIGSGAPFVLPDEPARDDRYLLCNFYWPDILDPSVEYGDRVTLQLRAAVSHLNEVWAVETAGAILHGLADELGWEFVVDAARWTYDESRHMLMGQQRIAAWGLEPAQVPLAPFIYQACSGQDPLYRLGMLGYFETKNIHKKPQRAQAFRAMGDDASRRHMEFDWADETIHAEYGRRWLKQLLESRDRPASEWSDVLSRCEELVDARVAAATDEDRMVTAACATALVAEAQDLARDDAD